MTATPKAANQKVANPKVRVTGAVLVGLALLSLIGTVTGLDAHGTGGRIVLGVVGVLFLFVGVALLRTRTPAVPGLDADEAGLHVTVAGSHPVTLAWSDLDAVWLRRLSSVFGGYLLLARPAPGASTPHSLRPFERRSSDGSKTIMIGLTKAQSTTLPRRIPALAGDRYRRPA